VAFSYTNFYTTLYFVNQRNYKPLAMQAHVLTRTCYFCSLNVIISHPIVYKEGLGYHSVCAIASRSSPPTHVCICNGHSGSEVCCIHCTYIYPTGINLETEVNQKRQVVVIGSGFKVDTFRTQEGYNLICYSIWL
jgi:hypothetical protein